MSDEEAPKTAYELILERLKQKDRADGVEERTVTPEQKAKIGSCARCTRPSSRSARSCTRPSGRKAADPEALEQIEADYRRDRERIASERDRKIDELRGS